MTQVYQNPEEARLFFQSLITQGLENAASESDENIQTYLTEVLLSYLYAKPTPPIDLPAFSERSLLVVRQGLSLPEPVLKQARETHKQIGDSLLFWLGIFPERLKRSRRQGEPLLLLRPVTIGKTSYKIVSLIEEQVAPENAPLFRKLSQKFEQYVLALRTVKKDLTGNA